MIVHTESGSRYEIDRSNRRARKLDGEHTGMTDGGGWRSYLDVFGPVIGSSMLIVWGVPGEVSGNRATVTTAVTDVTWLQ